MSKLRRNKTSASNVLPQQSKISSFFQAASEPVVSKPALFSCIAPSSAQQSVSNAYCRSTDRSSTAVAVTDRSNATAAVSSHTSERDSTLSAHKVAGLVNISHSPTETVSLKTSTEGQCSVYYTKLKDLNTSLNDSELIPDTPEDLKENTDRRKFQRSFLSSCTNLFADETIIDKKPAPKPFGGTTRPVKKNSKQKIHKAHSTGDFQNCSVQNENTHFNSESVDLEISTNFPILSSADGKRSYLGIFPDAKRPDHKLTPEKVEEVSKSARGKPLKLFEQEMPYNTKSRLSTLQIIQASRTTKKTPVKSTHDRGLDLENDGELLGVLNELKDYPQENENLIKKTAISPTADFSCDVSTSVKTDTSKVSDLRKTVESCVIIDNDFLNRPELPIHSDKERIYAIGMYGGDKNVKDGFKNWHDDELDALLSELRQESLHESHHRDIHALDENMNAANTPEQLCVEACENYTENVNAMDTYQQLEVQSCEQSVDKLYYSDDKYDVSQCSELMSDDAFKEKSFEQSLLTEVGSASKSQTDPIDCRDSSVCLSKHESQHLPFYHKFGRHKVIGVSNGNQMHLKLASVSPVANSAERTAILDGFWRDTHVNVGDIVNIVGDFDESGCCSITNDKNFIVAEPDTLLSGTSVVSSIHCMRRAVLSEKFKNSEFRNQFMLHGSIVHFVFQKILLKKSMKPDLVKHTIDETLQQIQFTREMYALGLSEALVRAEIDKYQPQIAAFLSKYCDSATSASSLGSKEDVVVTNIADIEENVWSPRFGIKGKIDLTVDVKIRDKNKLFGSNRTVPLELKTGKTTFSAEHMGQVTLYSMMCSERRDEVEAGILLYLKDLAIKMIPANYANKRGLIQLRNEMAFYMKRSVELLPQDESSENVIGHWPFGTLPEPINSERTCSNCPQLISCSLYQNIEQWKSSNQSHAMSHLVPKTLSHLSDAHLDYFRHWCLLLHLEAVTERRLDDEVPAGIWMQTGPEREKSGNCISCLALDEGKCSQLGVDKHLQAFKRHIGHSRSSSSALCDVGIQVTDTVIVSSDGEKPFIAMATGSVVEISDDVVIIVTDRDLRDYTDLRNAVYRLDRCNTYNSMSVHITNLARLMENTQTSEKLRRLIIDKSSPRCQPTMSRTVIEKVQDIMKPLNKPQKAAILKVLMSKDYMLIKGYPGTGKTSTIVALIRILVRTGRSVLLVSYTHSAVDNILLKLQKHSDVDFIRLGRAERIHASIQKSADEILTRNIKSVDQLTDFYASKMVVATTCLGVRHALFARRTFDVCIVDEASQVSLPACLGPLFHCQQFVLVGDPRQLVPVIRSQEARARGMDESLFVRLENEGATCELSVQYRMNSAVMKLSNELIYGGALTCGNGAVSQARLNVTPGLIVESAPCHWLQRCVSGAEGDEVIWLDIDPLLNANLPLPSHLQCGSSPVQNLLEAAIVKLIVGQLIEAGTSSDDVGVIAPYQQQVRVIRDSLKMDPRVPNIEVNTVDQYQGRDKSAIVMSFVRTSQTAQNAGKTSNKDILADERRLNVALTRARHKLILVGSVKSLSNYAPLHRLLSDILNEDQTSNKVNRFKENKFSKGQCYI